MNMVVRILLARVPQLFPFCDYQQKYGNSHALVRSYIYRDYVLQAFILRKDDSLILNTFQRVSH